MDSWMVVLLMVGAAGAGAGAVLVLSRHRLGGPAVWQHQLLELSARVDELVRSQHQLPATMAENRAAQAAAITREFADLARMLTTQLARAEQTMGDRLSDAGSAVADVRERLGQLAEATQRLESLGTTIGEVQDLLRVPHLRGALGEVWLEELLRQIFPESLYEMQFAFPTGERVDAVLRIGPRLVPIDAKFPLDVGERARDADARERAKARRAFERSVRGRIDEIANRYIRPADGTYDFGLMYVPSERVFSEVLNTAEDTGMDGGLMAYAMGRRVIPVSPNTFYAYLMAILHGLRGLQVESRADEVLRMLEGVGTEIERCLRARDIAGKHLENAVRQHGEIGRILDRMHGQVVRFADPDSTVHAAVPTASPDRGALRYPRDELVDEPFSTDPNRTSG